MGEKNNTVGGVGFEDKLWAAAGKLRGQIYNGSPTSNTSGEGDIAALSRSIADARVDLNPHQISAVG